MTAIKKWDREQDIIVADNIACFINGVLHFYIKQYNTKQSSTICRHNGFHIYRMGSVKENEKYH